MNELSQNFASGQVIVVINKKTGKTKADLENFLANHQLTMIDSCLGDAIFLVKIPEDQERSWIIKFIQAGFFAQLNFYSKLAGQEGKERNDER